MPLPPSIRTAIPLVIGLALGVFGASAFRESLPGEKGSAQERAAKLEVELKRANNRIASLEAADPRARHSGRTTRDGLRDIAEDLRAGRPVTPDDIFRTMQPLMRDLSPIFDRIRIREEQRRTDSLSGEIARKYNLTTAQAESLKKFFAARAEENAKRFSDLIAQEGVTLEQVARASMEVRPDDGLDEFMARTLTGDKLTDFQTERMAERAERVQQEADGRVERLDRIVGLDETQRDNVFAIMARASRDYDPAMGIEGADGSAIGASGGTPREAVLGILTAEQRARLDEESARLRADAEEELGFLGLSLPENWEPLDDLITR